MTLLRELITIPTSVSEGDFVIRASEGADLTNYVVTEQLKESFRKALALIGHAVTNNRSQASFVHGSFGSGKSHFMAVLREILKHNPQARAVRGLAEPVAEADTWLRDCKVLCLTFHMLDAKSVEQAVLEGYLNQITTLHPDAPAPAVHHSDGLLAAAANIRSKMGDDTFFAALGDGPQGDGLSAIIARKQGWTSSTYDSAALQPPGSKQRDTLVSSLTKAFFSDAVRSGEYLDLDTGLQVITRHAKNLGYDVVVLFLDELILWLSNHIADHTFVNIQGAKLNKLVESSDAARPLPLVSFVARQRNLEEFLGPQVGGTEREALADIMRSVQGRLGQIGLADTNLPEITEKRLLRPNSEGARQTIDDAFAAVRGRRDVWDTLLDGAQYGDAGIGSDASSFRRLYPFSPALVATLVALSQALQRERTALRVMTELLVARRDTLAVNDLIGVASLFEPLVLRSELPDRLDLRQQFQAARDTYQQKLRPLLLAQNGINEEESAGHDQFQIDDRLIKTLLLGALVPEVPALRNLTASRLHALNFGSIASPLPGYENQIVIDRLTKLIGGPGGLHKTDTPDPVFSLKLSSVDYDRLLELVPGLETAAGVLQQLIRDMIGAELGLGGSDEVLGEFGQPREWRGRRHQINVKFGNIRDKDTMPDSAIYATGDVWRIVIDYPFDVAGRSRRDDYARIEKLDRGSRSVFWLPYFLTDDQMARMQQLVKINYLLGNGGAGDRLTTLAADWSLTDRQQGKIHLRERQQQLRGALLDTLKQAYGVVKAQAGDVEADSISVLHTLAEGLQFGDPRGGTIRSAYENLTADLLRWSYPGTPALPEDEKPISRAEMAKVWAYAKAAAADPTHATVVDATDRRTVARICNPLQLGEIVDNRYALTSTHCWWVKHLAQEGAKQGYKERFPVHALRGFLDLPAPRGFDRDMQNLIIAVFAAEQQLAWYEHGGKVELGALTMINDQMELRYVSLPDEELWDRAVRRAKPIFGRTVPEWRSAAAVSSFATTVRQEASAHVAETQALVDEMKRRSGLLGLDLEAKSGRFATAGRVVKLLRDVVSEKDDNELVAIVAGADVGNIDDKAAATAYKQARAVTEVLTRTNWPLLDAVAARIDYPARVIIDELRMVAAHDEHAQELVPALAKAVSAATALLAQVDEVIIIDDGKLDDESRKPVRRPGPRKVVDLAGLDALAAEIRGEIESGATVWVSWEVTREP